jgi:hypothetical protein
MATPSDPDPREEPIPDTTESGHIDPELREQEAIRHITEQLEADYAQEHPAAEIEHVVEEKQTEYADAPVRDFVPILVERDARETLDESG